jgi:hypothetical protein
MNHRTYIVMTLSIFNQNEVNDKIFFSFEKKVNNKIKRKKCQLGFLKEFI